MPTVLVSDRDVLLSCGCPLCSPEGRVKALDGLDLDVYSGLTVLLGHNGAGVPSVPARPAISVAVIPFVCARPLLQARLRSCPCSRV